CCDNRTRARPLSRLAFGDQAFEQLAHARQIGEPRLDHGQFSLRQPPRIAAALSVVQREQTAYLGQGKAQVLRTLDKTHALHRFAGIATVSAQGLDRFTDQPAPLVVADSLDVHRGRLGQTSDCDGIGHGSHALIPYHGTVFMIYRMQMDLEQRMTATGAKDSLEQRMTALGAKGSLAAGVLAAIGASLCCVVPLVLLVFGIGGAWIGNLTPLEPYRPIFIGLTLLFLGLAFRRLY